MGNIENESITVRDLTITYRPLNKISVKKNFFHGRKKPDPFVAVNNISFDVKKGEILGLIGKNGSGKSTLLKSMAGIFSADKGTIDLHGQSIGLLAIGAGFLPEMSGRANIYIAGMLMGFSESYIKSREQEIIEFSEIGDFIEMPVKSYSSGMYSKLAFAITATLETDIILVDEVLSVGDEHFKKKSFERMKQIITDENKTVLIVSHSGEVIKELCNRVIWLNDGKIVDQGDPAEIMVKYNEYMK